MASVEVRRNAAGKVTSYRVRWRTGKVDGKWRWDSRSFDTRSEAVAFMGKVEEAGNRAPEPKAPKSGGLTVATLVAQFIDERAKRVRSDRTPSDYRTQLDTHIRPAFENVAAADLTADDVQAWVDGIDRAPKTVANVHGLLSAAFKWGVGRQLVAANPCVGTELPRKPKAVKRGLRAGEWSILYQAAVDTDPDAADLLLFLVGTGWRWSEATALQVLNCDLDRPDPRVEVVRVHRRDAKGRIVTVDDAKSDAGLRPVRLSPRLADMLRRRVTGRALGELVFPSPTGKPWRHSNFRDRKWLPIVEKARERGLMVAPTIHWLRHTQAALAIDSGANLAAVQKRLGHESITTTIGVYGSMIDEVPADVLARMDEALFGRANLRAVDGQ